jgi:hypothetical protein
MKVCLSVLEMVYCVQRNRSCFGPKSTLNCSSWMLYFDFKWVLERKHCYHLFGEMSTGRICIANHGMNIQAISNLSMMLTAETGRLAVRWIAHSISRSFPLSVCFPSPFLLWFSFDKWESTRLASISYDLLKGFSLHCVFFFVCRLLQEWKIFAPAHWEFS